MNKNLTEKIYNDMTTLLKEKNLIKSIPSLTIVDAFKEVDCQAYIVTHEVNGIEKYEVYVNDSSYDDIVKNLKTNKEKSINDLYKPTLPRKTPVHTKITITLPGKSFVVSIKIWANTQIVPPTIKEIKYSILPS